MRSFTAATATYFAQRSPFLGHVLLWVSALNRETEAVERIGFWTGVDHREFTIDGQARLYYAAGAFLKMEPIRRRTGLQVQTQRISLSQIAPEVQMLIRGYEPRHAPVEVHRALFEPLSENLVDEPHVLLRGYIDKVTLTTPAKNEGGSVSIDIATEARSLTKPLQRFRSDATLKERRPGDGFRQYASMAESVDTPWGQEASARNADENRTRGTRRPDFSLSVGRRT